MLSAKISLYVLIVMQIFAPITLFSQTWFPVGSGVNNTVNAVISFNNELYAAGKFTTAGATDVNHIARWNGTLWQLAGAGLDSDVTALAVYNNELYAGGKFLSSGGNPVSHIAKWNGFFWSDISGGINGDVNALVVFDGELYAGGNFSTAGTRAVNNIARWNGGEWEAVGTGISGGTSSQIYAMAVYNDSLIVGGDFTSAGGIAALNIAKWNGSSWSALGAGLDNYVYTLIEFSDNLYAGGRFTSSNSFPIFFIAMWNNSVWSSVGLGVNNVVHSFGKYGDNLYVGGDFTSAAGLQANHVARWNGDDWTLVGSGTNGRVQTFCNHRNELYTAGNFTLSGGVDVHNIAKLTSLRKFRTFRADTLLSFSPKKLRVKRGTISGYPNITTAAANVFFHLGKKGGVFLGYENKSKHAWIAYKKIAELQKMFTESHTGPAYPIDTLRKDKKRKPLTGLVKAKRKDYNNVAWEQGIIFNLNLYASVYGVTPTGFDSLVIDSSASLAGPYLRGKSLRVVGKYFDSVMTFYNAFGINNPAAYALLQTFVDSVLRPINQSFYSPIDTSGSDYNINVNEITQEKNYYAVYLNGVKTTAEAGGLVHEEISKKSFDFSPRSDVHSTIPETAELLHNFPNPFNPTTTIRFTLPAPDAVSLIIYNVLGQEIATLLNNEEMDEGEHEIMFDASALSSGLYFYRLAAGAISKTKKMILQK